MKSTLYLLLWGLLWSIQAHSQAYFLSTQTGKWNDSATWQLVSGTSTSNYPLAGDSVVIAGTDTIKVETTAQCQSLTIKGTSLLRLDSLTSILTVTNNISLSESSKILVTTGLLTSTGNFTLNQSSSFTQNGGIVNVVGLVTVVSPTSSAGTTLLDIEGGAFNCVGGLTITATTVPSGRFAQMKIGNSAVNVLGALTTVSANAKITFTGIGALTLAGFVTVSTPSSFSAGNGTVIYFGIPGTDQTIAPLTYNILIITGVSSGVKNINGSVTVTDTLSLLSDTLVITSGGSLKLSDNANIIRTAGKLMGTPTFLGKVNVIYNNVLPDTTSYEIPTAPEVLQNLTINNISGVMLGANITLNNKLTLQNGALLTNGHTLLINNPLAGTLSDTAIERVNGYVHGALSRRIGTSTGIRTFPLGIGLYQGYRPFSVNYTQSPDAEGILTVQHFDEFATDSTAGLPITEASVTLKYVAPYYWQADASGGLSGGIYSITLMAEGTVAVTDVSTLRVLKRPSSGGNWLLYGSQGTNSGTNTAPSVERIGLSGFSQFTISGGEENPLPLTLLSFNVELNHINQSVILNWVCTNQINSDYFVIEKSQNALNFESIGQLFAQKVDYSPSVNYSFVDKPTEYTYYRLKIVDTDGTFEYSPIVYFSNKQSTLNNSVLQAIITKESIFIPQIPTEALLSIVDLQGRRLLNLQEGYNDVRCLGNGLYILVSDRGEFLKFQK